MGIPILDASDTERVWSEPHRGRHPRFHDQRGCGGRRTRRRQGGGPLRRAVASSGTAPSSCGVLVHGGALHRRVSLGLLVVFLLRGGAGGHGYSGRHQGRGRLVPGVGSAARPWASGRPGYPWAAPSPPSRCRPWGWSYGWRPGAVPGGRGHGVPPAMTGAALLPGTGAAVRPTAGAAQPGSGPQGHSSGAGMSGRGHSMPRCFAGLPVVLHKLYRALPYRGHPLLAWSSRPPCWRWVRPAAAPAASASAW